MPTQVESGPQLILDWHAHTYSRGWARPAGGSLVFHLFVIALLVFLASLPGPVPQLEPEIASNLSKAVRLYDPPKELTQKEPNRAKVSKEVNVEGLLPRPATKQTTPQPPVPPRQFKAPPPGPQAQEPQLPKLVEPPKLDAQANTLPITPPPAGAVNVPAPQIQSQEKPKLAFETPGQSGTSEPKNPLSARIEPPKAGVDDAIHDVARGAGGQGGIIVGDNQPSPSIPDSLRLPPSPPRSQSSLELLSDPMGVDFKPYLIRILATVRRNWFAVMPESAHMGRRGQVLLQFVIDRSGQVPKLVIATPSGAEALDRAAVAGISASVPFPPLPSEFHGREIRLQFAFKYNMQ